MAYPWLLSVALAAASVAAQGFPDCVNGPLSTNTVCDTTAPISARAAALVNAFTLAEKFNLTQNTSPGVPRLGLPAYQWWQEALHGVASSPGVNFSSQGDFSHATSFPQPILMSAAFDDELIFNVATVVSTEARAFNNYQRAGLDFWTPNINPFKDPRWGRGQETPGEDPFHLQSYVKNLIAGLQGGYDPAIKRIVATCKHFAAYDLEDWDGYSRNAFDAIVPTQDLTEYYLPPFQTCARDANVGSIMCSYNAVNGVPSCADPYLLQSILREHWGWTNENQYVTSDCDAIQNIYLPHNYTSTREQAAADALLAGTDLDCGTYYPIHLPGAYAEGLFNESTLDLSLTRLYSALLKLGYFDPATATPYRSLGWSDVSTPAADALALQAAEEGMVLLKNDGTLPLSVPSGNLSVALVGSWANASTQMQGNYYGIAPYLHGPVYALQQMGITVNVVVTNDPTNPTTGSWPAALNAANMSDIVIIVDGIDNNVESEGNDRNSISWDAVQLDLLGEIASMGKPTMMLQMGGGQLDDTPWLNNPNISAIIWGGYPGQDGGVALMNTVFGMNAPAGRLPITQYPGNYVNEVPMTDMNLRPNATSGNPGRTYRWYNGSVLDFGFGLHYTNFSLSVPSPGSGSATCSSGASSSPTMSMSMSSSYMSSGSGSMSSPYSSATMSTSYMSSGSSNSMSSSSMSSGSGSMSSSYGGVSSSSMSAPVSSSMSMSSPGSSSMPMSGPSSSSMSMSSAGSSSSSSYGSSGMSSSYGGYGSYSTSTTLSSLTCYGSSCPPNSYARRQYGGYSSSPVSACSPRSMYGGSSGSAMSGTGSSSMASGVSSSMSSSMSGSMSGPASSGTGSSSMMSSMMSSTTSAPTYGGTGTSSSSMASSSSTTGSGSSGCGLQSSYSISSLISACDLTTYNYTDLCPFATLPVTVTNTGSRTSDYVALGFLAGAFGPQPYPIKSLVAYQRLHGIAPGSSQTAQLQMTLGSLARHDENGNAVLYPGSYSVLVDVPTQATVSFTLTGSAAVIDAWPARPSMG